jgi:hypothetical protein
MIIVVHKGRQLQVQATKMITCVVTIHLQAFMQVISTCRFQLIDTYHANLTFEL